MSNDEKLEYLKTVRALITQLRDMPTRNLEYRRAVASDAFGYLNTVIAALEFAAEGKDKQETRNHE